MLSCREISLWKIGDLFVDFLIVSFLEMVGALCFVGYFLCFRDDFDDGVKT